MIAYSVLEPSPPPDDPIEHADRIAFVREGFAWLALLFPFIWLLVHGMWLVLLLFIAVVAAVNVGFVATGLGEAAASWATIAISVLFAFQANDLRRWTLERRGFKVIGAVSGRNRDECEIRFFADWDGVRQEADASAPTSNEDVPSGS